MSLLGLNQISSQLILIKSNWAIFHPTSIKRFMPTKFLELFIDGITLEIETVTKFLDVFIDKNVTWKDHINTISTKISKSTDILYRARSIIQRKHLNQLYLSFVHSYLSYANLSWGSTQKTKLFTLYRQQKHSMRLFKFLLLSLKISLHIPDLFLKKWIY